MMANVRRRWISCVMFTNEPQRIAKNHAGTSRESSRGKSSAPGGSSQEFHPQPQHLAAIGVALRADGIRARHLGFFISSFDFQDNPLKYAGVSIVIGRE